MATTIPYFLLPEDERALFRQLARHGITVYPELIPPGYQAPALTDALAGELTDAAYYLALERFGPVIVHAVKRGPDKGMLVIEEVPSPVFHYQRSLRNEAGELVAGRLWADLDGADAATSEPGKPRGVRHVFDDVHAWCRKTLRRSDPKGYWVGPRAGEAWKRGELKLREPGHKGRLFGVWR